MKPRTNSAPSGGAATDPTLNPAWAAFWQEAFRLHDLLLERRAAKHQAEGHPQDGTRR